MGIGFQEISRSDVVGLVGVWKVPECDFGGNHPTKAVQFWQGFI
jgi:hypothetical protein